MNIQLSAQEIEWLEYAVAHMQDDSEPEDAACAKVLQGLLDRVKQSPLGNQYVTVKSGMFGYHAALMHRVKGDWGGDYFTQLSASGSMYSREAATNYAKMWATSRGVPYHED